MFHYSVHCDWQTIPEYMGTETAGTSSLLYGSGWILVMLRISFHGECHLLQFHCPSFSEHIRCTKQIISYYPNELYSLSLWMLHPWKRHTLEEWTEPWSVTSFPNILGTTAWSETNETSTTRLYSHYVHRRARVYAQPHQSHSFPRSRLS